MPQENVFRMVVGNGLVAKAFESYITNDKFLVFASGVSNSKSTVRSDYEREFNLLNHYLDSNSEKTLVYFSTCSINDPAEKGSSYVIHKREIEHFIQQNVNQFFIFRVSNLVGKSSNNNTILNFIAHHVRTGTHFNIWQNATRNLIDVDDFFRIADKVVTGGLFQNQIINIANSINYTVPSIVETIEEYYNKKANYDSMAKGGSFDIDIKEITEVIDELGIAFNEQYLKNLLHKYY